MTGAVKYTDKDRENALNTIVECLLDGVSLKRACARDDVPSYITIQRWRRTYPEFDDTIRRAREDGTDALADQALEIADNPDIDAQQKHHMIGTRLRLIGKWNRALYGDRIDHAVEGNVTIQVIDSFGEEVKVISEDVKAIEHDE